MSLKVSQRYHPLCYHVVPQVRVLLRSRKRPPPHPERNTSDHNLRTTHPHVLAWAPVTDVFKGQFTPTNSSQNSDGMQHASQRTKRKSTSQPDPVKRQGRSRSSIRFPSEDPRDTIKMTQIFLEDEPWHSCYAKGCYETFAKFTALGDHVRKVHPKRKPSKYSCPLKSCKVVATTPHRLISF